MASSDRRHRQHGYADGRQPLPSRCTITGGIENIFTGTIALDFDATKVAFVSGQALARLYRVHHQNSPAGRESDRV